MNRKVIEYDSFVPYLLERVPELEGVYHEHLKDYDELLPHVFLGDVCRFLAELYSRNKGDRSASNRIIDIMDEGFRFGDEQTKGLVCVSFLENIPHDNKVYDQIKMDLTPVLREAVKDYE
jgi:hypothetical protein